MGTDSMGTMTDDELLRSLKDMVRDEKANLVAILRRLVELERRELAQRLGRPSLFAYLVRDLGYSEAEASWRLRAARAAARNPSLLRLLKRGRLTLCAVAMLEPHLRRGNARELIRSCIGLSTRGLEAMLAQLGDPRPPADKVRYVAAAPPPARPSAEPPPGADLFCLPPAEATPSPRPPDTGDSTSAAPRREPEADLPPAPRVHFSFTADETLLRDVERAKELLRHKHPAGRLEEIFAEAIDALLERAEPERRLRRKEEQTTRASAPEDSCKSVPQPAAYAAGSRRIPQAVKDAVWRRDAGCCAYVGTEGRCGERSWLEYDHIVPWAIGGRSDDPANVRLLCRAHNRLEARRILGPVIPESDGG